MPSRPNSWRFALITGLALGSLVVPIGVPNAYAAPEDPKTDSSLKAPKQSPQVGTVKEGTSRSDRLGSHDRELLARAEGSKSARVTVMLATDKKQATSVAAAVRAAGGWTGMVNDQVGYVRASIPTSAVDRVAKLRQVVAVDLDEEIPLDDPSPATAAGAKAARVAAPGPKTPDANPYMPTRDTGSTAFRKSHPTWDGRGVTIGILDSGVDLDHPALQTTSTGDRKIVDWVTATDPLLDADFSWRPMLTEVEATPTFTYQGATWTAPAEGTYTINRFNEAITAESEPGGDVNRDGDTTDLFGVLYDYATHDIWVDVNQDRTFSTSELIKPYNQDFQIGHFGTDNPSTDVVESMPFVVEYREDVSLAPAGIDGVADFVNIGIPQDAHGTHVAGIASAYKMFGGKMNGQAPGAKIVSSRACSWDGGCTAAALTDGMVDLVANRHVDVVNMSIGGLPALNDGNNARSVLYNRLISDYGVQLFISAGNSGPGLNTIGDPSVATDVVSVASSISKQTWLSNYGSVVSSAQNLHNFSSRGPREDGGLKPTISAPGSAVSTVPRWLKQPDLAEAGYTLPIGYAHFNGTSMASPQAAGSAALLLSAALAKDLDVTPRRLRDALYTSAVRIPKVSVAGQGTGRLNVPATWKLLQKRSSGRNYTVDAPVCTPISSFLAVPDRGTGLYNRCAADDGGHTIGVTKSYSVNIIRLTGKASAKKHRLRLIGNDGTFSVASTLTLTRGKSATLKVKVKTRTQGAHAAILQVDDPATAVVDLRIPLTIVQSRAATAPSYDGVWSSSVQRNLTKSYFITVPDGAAALQVNLTGIAVKSQTRFIAINPYGVPVESTASTACYTNFSDVKDCKPTSRSYPNPLPGVWEFEVESRRTSPMLRNPFTLTAAVQSVEVTPATQTIASATLGEPTAVNWTVTNQYGPLTVTAEGGALGSSHTERPTIADLATQNHEVTVPAGAESFTATIGNPSDQGADLDLSVFLDDVLVGQSADGDSEESVTIRNPEAGTYTVVVDGFAVPAGTTDYDYLDVFYAAALGELVVDSGPFDLATGGTAPVTGEVVANQAPTGDRKLFGQMRVLSDEDAVLGTGTVEVTAINP